MKALITFLISFIILCTPAKSKNTLVIRQENAYYEIKDNYDLAGTTIAIPDGCTLRFAGGKISNGTLKGSRTMVDASYSQIFGDDLRFQGTWNVGVWLPEWFGAKGAQGNMDTKAIQCALDAARDTDSRIVKLQGKTYYTDATLTVYPYTSLIGADLTASWLHATQIIPTKEVDAILLTATGKDVRSAGVTLKNLIIRNGARTKYTNAGILMCKDTERFGVSRLRMENVQVLYFDNGIMADLYGSSPFAYCDFRNVECDYNNIGFYVEGHFEGGKNGHMVWMNVNRFEFCRFSENRIGGIYVHNVWNFLNNVFDQCSIERNGKNYTLSLYKQNGVFGAKFANWYSPSTGGNAFQNCYFEINLPRREGGLPENGEYKYGKAVFPVDFTESKAIGNVILQQHDFSFINCISSRNKNFVLVNDNSHIRISGTTVYDMEKVSKTDSKRYFIEFNDAYVQSSVFSDGNHFNISKENKLQYFHFIATPQGSISKYTILKTDTVDGGTVKLENSSVKKLLRQ